MSRSFACAAWIVVLAGATCSKPQPAAGPPKPAQPATHIDEIEKHDGLPSKVRLSPQIIKNSRIRTALAITGVLPATVDVTGEIAVDPDRSARLSARVAGRVVDVRFKEGERVKAGQVVATLESPELARARAALTSAQAKAQAARLNADRVGRLETKALASGQEVAAAGAEAQARDAEATAARQTITAFGPGAEQVDEAVARMTLRSPIAGFVLSRDAVQGQTVNAEHIVAVIGDFDRAYFLGRLFEKDLAQVQAGSQTEIRLNAYPGEIFEGRVETIGKQMDPVARTVLARISVKNHADLLKAGLFGSAHIVTGTSADRARRVVVSMGAVTKIADHSVVFVQQSDGDFELHPVTLGRSAAGLTEILSGLRQGELVVVEGVFTLKSTLLRSTFGEEP